MHDPGAFDGSSQERLMRLSLNSSATFKLGYGRLSAADDAPHDPLDPVQPTEGEVVAGADQYDTPDPDASLHAALLYVEPPAPAAAGASWDGFGAYDGEDEDEGEAMEPVTTAVHPLGGTEASNRSWYSPSKRRAGLGAMRRNELMSRTVNLSRLDMHMSSNLSLGASRTSTVSEKDTSTNSGGKGSPDDSDSFSDTDEVPARASFVDQLLAVVERSTRELWRRKLDLLLDITVPLIFVVVSIALWAIWGTQYNEEMTYVSTNLESGNIGAAGLRAPATYDFTCMRQPEGTPTLADFTRCKPMDYTTCDSVTGECKTQSIITFICDGDSSMLPLPEEYEICRVSYDWEELITAGLSYYWRWLSAVPTLDMLIGLQWTALSAYRYLLPFIAKTMAGLAANTRYSAILCSGHLYFVGERGVTSELIAYMNRTSGLFQYVTDFQVYSSVAEARSAARRGGRVWAIVELRQIGEAGLDLVLHMNNSALPSFATTYDDAYSGGVLFDTAELYMLSGFNTLQQLVSEFYLNTFHDAQMNMTQMMAATATPEYKRVPLMAQARQVLPLIFSLAFLYSVSQQTKRIVLEKELRIREAMQIMGLKQWTLYASELIVQMAIFVPTCVLCVVMLKLTYVTKSDPLILFLIFCLFALTTIPLSGMIAAFFSKSRLASLVAPVVYFILVIPMFAMTNAQGLIVTWFSVFSPTGFAAALNVFLLHESGSGCGAAEMMSSRDNPTLAVVLVMLAVDCCMYYALMLYLDAVLPKQWGTPKHPLFFIMEPVRWFSGPSARVLEGGADGRAENGVFEEITEGGADYAVCATGLRKEYSRGGKRFVAVNNLYWGMREGEISVLLGHNGAGKTTVLNMMTGMVEPDAGDCYINGSSVRNELNQVRRQIGYCPQHNILWGELTCREHLEYYGKIKGLFGGVLEDVVRRILNEVDLLDKMEYPSRALSGGQKRKLSVAIAFVGLSPLVFLDEPTAGMDVGARRYTWELLRRMSEAHTIMLTTHYMDEADLLGHKIGIMSRGRMQCSGSSMFLKSRLGVGYNIVISVDPEVDAEAIDRLVVSLVPGAEASCFNGCEIVYKLPMRDLELFPSLLESLEENGKDAGVRGYSLSATTLEEVFLQIVMDEMKNHKASTAVEENEEVVEEENNAVWNCEMMTGTRQRLVSQFKAMMVKRLQNALRDRKMQCFQVVCPVVCVMVAMLLTLFSFTEAGSLSLTSEMFGETVQMQVSGCEKYFGATNNVTRQGSYITDLNFANGQDLSFYATDTAKQLTMPRYTSLFCGDPGLQHVVPFEFDATFLFYNTSAYHAGGLVLQQLYTYILQSFTNNVHRTFKTGAKPMPTTMRDSSVKDGVQTILMGAIIMIPFTFLPSNVVAWVVKERECKARHLQNVSGLSFYIYWLTNFLFDMVAYVMTLSLVLLIFLMFSRDEYVGKNTAGPAIVVFLIYGLCSTVSAYVVSFGFHEHSAAQSATMAVNFVAGFLLVMMVFILSLVDSTAKISRNLRWPFRLVPSYCVGESIINLAMDRQQAALNLPSNPWAMEVVGWPCVFMAIEFPIFLLATLFIDHPRRRMWGQTGSYDRCAPAEVVDDEDSDVEDEREEVYQQEKKNVNMDVVRVVDLRKVYPNGKVAVRNLAFSILPDEVFGFLGTNGAGKTTTISMLCQEFIPTSGNAYVCGYDIVTESEQALQCIGYCPQFDATLDLLTVEEHLHLYAGIRGILYEQRSKVVAGLMRLCDITEFRDTMSAQLSGGNRRKLSVALSLIGGPRVVFLDEPSAGMDPVARRGLWTAIQKVSQNCSVVLTTHHLEEVEALADTVGIMADGALRCIGDKIHLKQKYGSGFELSVRVAQRDVRAAVQRFVGENFPAAVLNEFKGKRLVFALPQDTKLSEAFWQLQQNKRRLHITDYTVSQTSIEQVFLRISEQQEERDELGKKKVTHFVKSHATPHAYNGVATKKKRRQEPAEKTVLVSSAAMEAYRRRKLMAGIVDEVARSEKNDRIGRHGEEESDEVDNAVRNFNTAGSQCAPARRGSVSNVHGASSGRKRCAVNFVAAAGEDPSAGHATPYSNTYGPSSEGQAYGHGYDYDSSSGYGYPNQYNGNGESFRYDYGYNLHTGGAAGHQQPQNAYNSYCGGGKTKYS